MKVYDLVSGKRTYGFLGAKPSARGGNHRENNKPIWQGKGKKDERATRRFPGSLSALVLRGERSRTRAGKTKEHAEKKARSVGSNVSESV